MNNRYICRGKRKDNDEWVEGYLIQGNRTYIVTIEAINCMVVSTSYMASIELVEVIPETVGQCTGLEDMNGKLMFEGDVVRTKYYGKIIKNRNVADYDIFKVVYAYAMFRAEKKNRAFNLVSGERYEVIDNIYDNPELLEVER